MNTKTIARTSVKIVALGLVIFCTIRSLTFAIPPMQGNLGQTARNLFFHVPMWFAMMACMGYSVVASLLYLQKGERKWDIRAREGATVGMLFGMLGLTTGIVWSRATWGELLADNDFSAWWHWDPKQTTVLICLLIYSAYFVLRGSFEDPALKARISSAYNIFAAASIIPLFYILPRAMGGLHPGAEGNQATILTLGPEFKMLFWLATLGYILLSVWLTDLRVRMGTARQIIEDAEAEIN